MPTFSQARDTILEVLQHEGGWLNLATIQVKAEVPSSSAVYEALQELVGYDVVSSRKGNNGTEWRAIMEHDGRLRR